MMVLFKDAGACAMYSYEDRIHQAVKMEYLNGLEPSVFTNKVFESTESGN